MKRPTLVPPCPDWKEDFSPPSNPINTDISSKFLSANHQDNIYLETSRNSIIMRELLFACALINCLCIILGAGLIINNIIYYQYTFILLKLAILLLATCQTASFLRMIHLTPRDEPIRFNRARQKIYAYNFTYCWWNPFIPWPVKIANYDWRDVRAERWRKQAVTHQGSHLVKTGIMLSIVEPGTNKVIDRFPLTNLVGEESVWAYICTYMQHGLTAVPPAPLNRDHNDILWCQFAMRLAPEVKWPVAIDHESRTAPQTAPLVKVESP